MAEVDVDGLRRMLDYVIELARGLALELHNANPDAAASYGEKLEDYAKRASYPAAIDHANYIAGILRDGKKPQD